MKGLLGDVLAALFVIAAVLTWTACSKSLDRRAAVEFRYFRDPKTGLCFAGFEVEHRGELKFSCVPCTPAVEAEIAREADK